MTRLIRFVDQILAGALIAFMALLVINVIWQVASRYLLDDPSSFTEEVARFLLLWIGLLGGCYAYRTRSHLGLDLLTQTLSNTAQRWVSGFVLAVIVLFALAVLTYGGGRLVWLTLELKQTSAALGIPMGYIYTVLPLSGILITFYSVVLWQSEVEEEES